MIITPNYKDEGNALIAQFEGYRLITPSMRKIPESWSLAYWEKERPDKGRQVISTEHTLPYFTSYEAMMRVVELIESRPECIRFDITPTHVHILLTGNPGYKEKFFYDAEELTKKETIWVSIVQCIKWFNSKDYIV